jgi:hypothetical protein
MKLVKFKEYEYDFAEGRWYSHGDTWINPDKIARLSSVKRVNEDFPESKGVTCIDIQSELIFVKGKMDDVALLLIGVIENVP